MKPKNLLSVLFFILISISSFSQTIPPVNLEQGYIVRNGHIVYPSPDADYTTVIEVGPGKTYTELYDVPENNVAAGTLIKIYYRSEPYRVKIYLKIQAADTAHFRIQGIPDANGNLPVITQENSTHNWGGGTVNQWVDNLGIIVINGSYGSKPSWIELVNLHLKVYGTNERNGDIGVWSKADHISIKGCVLDNCSDGVFFQAANNNMAEMSTYNLVEGCHFTHCGVYDNWFMHNIYTQGAHSLIQFNYIEQEQTGALGSTMKDRASYSVIRYNYMEATSRTIDLVEPEDAEVGAATPDWDDAYVYGNLIINKRPNSGVMFHYGWDDMDDPYEYQRKGTYFFVNNTVIMDFDDGSWNKQLFDVNKASTKITFANNIVLAKGMHYFYIFRTGNNNDGGTINFTTSWLKAYATDNNNNWQLNDGNGDFHMTNENNLLTGNKPGFTDTTNNDYTLVDTSACRHSGTKIDSVLIEYNPIMLDTIIKRTDSNSPNMGCFSDINVEEDNISPSIPQNLQATTVSSSQINLTWDTSTDNIRVNGYRIYRNGNFLTTSLTNSYSDNGLQASTEYSYTVSAFDAAGNESAQSSSVNATTDNDNDTEAPTVPQNLQATAVSTSQINLTWDASTDNVAVAGYKVFRNGNLVNTVTNSTEFNDTGLNAATEYTYTVSAFDAAGNESAQSSSVSATTGSDNDTEAPTVPQNLQATVISASQIILTWNTSTDNVAVAGYKVFRNGNLVDTVINSTTFNNTGLNADTEYTYTVSAFDAAGNESTQSSSVSATTNPDIIKEIDESSLINIYPNPAKNKLQLELNNEKYINNNIFIYNIFGQVVKQLRADKKQLTVNITDLQDGIYFIKIGNTTKTFIVKKYQ